MSEYDNTNRGVLFKNDKGDNPKRPDYTGNINIDGRELALSAWLKESRKGNKFLSLAVSEPRQKGEKKTDPPPSGGGFVDSDIPFDRIRGVA